MKIAKTFLCIFCDAPTARLARRNNHNRHSGDASKRYLMHFPTTAERQLEVNIPHDFAIKLNPFLNSTLSSFK